MPSLLESIGKHLPDTWQGTDQLTLAPPKVPRCWLLSEDSDEYKTVKKNFCRTLPDVEPKMIQRVENSYLYGLYLLKKAEYLQNVSENALWHATSVGKLDNILKTNLDWRRAKRVRYGKGVSFSSSAKYADDQCNRSTPRDRVSILCKVPVYTVAHGTFHTIVPPGSADTTIGSGRLVFVKYADYEFYPEYVVYYSSPLLS